MKNARVAGLLSLVAAGLFLSLGLRGTPRNTAYIGLGVAFLALGLGAMKRSRQA